MKSDDIGVVVIFIFVVISYSIGIFMVFGLANDLSDKVTKLEKTNTELKQQITDLKWQLDQVDKMICNNDMLDRVK